MAIEVDGRIFSFPRGWFVEKYDDNNFYRNKFVKCLQNIKVKDTEMPGIKAVDILAYSPDRTIWLIEAKDYRFHRRTKEIKPDHEFALKVRDSLAGISACAMLTREQPSSQLICKIASEAIRIRLVYHFEQPAKHSKLFPRAFDIADIEQKMKSLLKGIDPHPMAIDEFNQARVDWTIA